MQWQAILLVLMLASPAHCQNEAKPEQIGQGEWNLVIKTESAVGEGCAQLAIDEEIRTGLIIQQKEGGTKCSSNSPNCDYVLNWKVSLDTVRTESDVPPNFELLLGKTRL